MVEWVLNRAVDILLALLVMAALLWCLLTQPFLSFSEGVAPDLSLERKVLESQLREVLTIPAKYTDDQLRFDATADYLRARLAQAGSVEQLERGDGLRILRIKVGNQFERKAFVGFHYVVTEKPILEVAETATGLIELAKVVAKADAVNMQLDLTVFLHKVGSLEQGLTDASIFHVDQIVRQFKKGDLGVLFAPGLRVPDAVYSSDQWKYFNYLLPTGGGGLSIFGRLKDSLLLRRLKSVFHSLGITSISSLNIPVSFPGIGDSPLKYYWDSNLPVFLVRPDILINDKNFNGHIKFISSWFGVLKVGLK